EFARVVRWGWPAALSENPDAIAGSDGIERAVDIERGPAAGRAHRAAALDGGEPDEQLAALGLRNRSQRGGRGRGNPARRGDGDGLDADGPRLLVHHAADFVGSIQTPVRVMPGTADCQNAG